MDGASRPQRAPQCEAIEMQDESRPPHVSTRCARMQTDRDAGWKHTKRRLSEELWMQAGPKLCVDAGRPLCVPECMKAGHNVRLDAEQWMQAGHRDAE